MPRECHTVILVRRDIAVTDKHVVLVLRRADSDASGKDRLGGGDSAKRRGCKLPGCAASECHHGLSASVVAPSVEPVADKGADGRRVELNRTWPRGHGAVSEDDVKARRALILWNDAPLILAVLPAI